MNVSSDVPSGAGDGPPTDVPSRAGGGAGGGAGGLGVVVAIVPAKDRADSVAATVAALLDIDSICRVVVVDDGSTDGTADVVRRFDPTGRACLVRLERNVGKAGAVRAGIEASPDADTYVLIDADLEATARVAADLLSAMTRAGADMVIGVPTTAAGRRGGLGSVRRLSSWGIRRAAGFETAAPLSGQRAVSAGLLRSLAFAERFGLETALTIDAVRSGASVMEEPIEFDHRHTGRSVSGFVHRGRQGIDIARALWPRLTTARVRRALPAVCAALFLVGAIGLSFGWEADSVPVESAAPRKVVLFGMPRLALEDLDTGVTPNLDRLYRRGALAATSVRTLSGRPSTVEAYATVGAGARVRIGGGGQAYAATDPIGTMSAADVARSRTGLPVRGGVVVPSMAEAVLANAKRFVPSDVGALGDALHAAGRTTAAVGNSDVGDVHSFADAGFSRPAAIAVADSSGSVDVGDVSGDLLAADNEMPSGVRVDRTAFREAARRAMREADVTALDPGEIDRVFALKSETAKDHFEALRLEALTRTDEVLGDVAADLPPGALLIVTSTRPATARWELTPTVIYGAGVRVGDIHSPSTRRRALITLTDLAPTILEAQHVAVPPAMIGHPLRVHPTAPGADLGGMRNLNRLSAYREQIYLPLTKGYVIFQAVVYLLTILLFSARVGVGSIRRPLQWVVLGVAAWPLATFVFRVLPHTWVLRSFGGLVVIAIDALLVAGARRWRRHPLSALSVLLGATVAFITIDVSTGARFQQASILGYSPHTAARFTGLGNAAFAALAVCTVLWCVIHVQYAPRRGDALVTAACVCAVVFVADGAPMLGSDVGGILTLAPVFGLLLYSLLGRRLNVRSLGIAGLATFALLGMATVLDLLRPPDRRSHLGRFFTGVGDDRSTFTTTIGRKLATNVRVLTGSFWTWIVPIIALTLLFFLVVQRGWERDMARGSALRSGVVGALLAGLLGFAVNDSGAVVTALVFVELGPLITLLALARPEARVPPTGRDHGTVHAT